MEEKTHRNSPPLTIMTVLAVILLIAAVILSVICVRQRNMPVSYTHLTLPTT